jgi:DNA ligase-1
MRYLNNGDSFQVKGSGRTPYTIRMIAGVIDCSCPAWRNMGGGIDSRACKHIRANVDPACWPQAARDRAGIAATGNAAPAWPPVWKPTAPPVPVYHGTPVLPIRGAAATPAPVAKPVEVGVMLAHSWEGQDPSGWWMSEKLDGVRAYWTGEKLLTRLGNEIHAPDWFLGRLPKTALDGELFAGRGKFQETVSIVRKLMPDDAEWRGIAFWMFDAPDLPGGFEQRQTALAKLMGIVPSRPGTQGGFTGLNYRLLKQERCHGREHLDAYMDDVIGNGGEGVMLRAPNSAYERTRTWSLLKCKRMHDAEARVIGYEPGRGKHKGRVGALVCRTATGTVEFKIGTGLSDREREAPPAVGSLVTYSYQELTRDGVPRFPAFKGVRDYE